MSCSCFNFLLLASCSNSSVFLYSAIRSSFCFRNESWKLLFAVSPPSWAVLVMELFFLENNKAKKCPIERNIDVVEIVQDFSMFSTMRKLNNVRRILWKTSFNHPSTSKEWKADSTMERASAGQLWYSLRLFKRNTQLRMWKTSIPWFLLPFNNHHKHKATWYFKVKNKKCKPLRIF